MKPMIRPRVSKKHTSLVLRTTFGSLNLTVVLSIVLLLILLDFFSSAVHQAITQGLPSTGAAWIVWSIQIAAFPAWLLLLWVRARKASRRVHTHIEEHTSPRSVKALVLFLSTKGRGQDDALIEKLVKEGGEITDDALREKFQGPWRMPLEAVAYHLRIKKLEKVVVIQSKQSADCVQEFKSLIQSLSRDYTSESGKPLEVLITSDMDGLDACIDAEQKKKHNGRFPVDSVSFENATDQSTLLNAVLDWLTFSQDVPFDEIMIDVTGGKKVSSVVGAVVALGKDWSVEYVSTSDYRVKEYIFSVKASDVMY